MRPVIPHLIPRIPNPANDWFADYPNPADFQFDYYKLLALAQQSGKGIGSAPGPGLSVAIVGAGAAGMTAARELFRAGYIVTIYEASDRLCGRHFTLPVPGQSTGMELGAMRFPFFSTPGSQNSVFDYYMTTEANATTFPFPNPGSAPGNTGIFVNQGYGPNNEFFPNKKMIIWANDGNPPPDPALTTVSGLVTNLINFFRTTVGGTTANPGPYGTAAWPQVWEQIANRYDKMSFSDLVFADAITTYQNDGWLGGFGMNDSQSELFYTIGAGDGSWGAFYEVAAMWFIRCVMFGFNSNLQSLVGPPNPQNLPHYNDNSVHDSDGNQLPAPLYSGIQSLVEWLFYQPAPGEKKSLYDALVNSNASFGSINVKRAVTAITKLSPTGPLQVTDQFNDTASYDFVIVTPQIWASQLSVALNGFSPNDLPPETLAARNEQHQIASCKVFFPLTETYWENPNCSIPQLIISDTFVQDAYGIQWSPNDSGVLLASYTWEDDALKLLPYDDATVASMVLNELDQITNDTLGEQISDYINANDAVVFQWSQQLGYSGCAKLYRQRSWTQNYALLAYNQQNSRSSGLYLAGETYGVEGGWTEPALRLALDAVIRIIQNSGGTFATGFNVANDYPSFDVNFTPDYSYNAGPGAARARKKASARKKT